MHRRWQNDIALVAPHIDVLGQPLLADRKIWPVIVEMPAAALTACLADACLCAMRSEPPRCANRAPRIQIEHHVAGWSGSSTDVGVGMLTPPRAHLLQGV